MTTHRTYTCNLCGDRIVEPVDGIGLYFGTVDEEGRHQPDIRFSNRVLHDCNTHLCTKCLRAIGLLLERTRLHVTA